MPSNLQLSKEDIYKYLFEVSKEYKKLSNRTPIQLIVVGGASIILNYGFRGNTVDIDAYFGISDAMKQAINNVSDRLNLPVTVLNDDFKYTNSFSHKLYLFSTFYKTFSNVVEVRTIKGEYLIAMKLTSARKIRHDRSDIIGILAYEANRGNNITFNDINKAIINLYGNWDLIEPDNKIFINELLKNADFSEIYNKQFNRENSLRNDVIKAFEDKSLKRNNESLQKIINELDSKI